MISDHSNDTTGITIDLTDPELYVFTLLKSSNAHNSGSIGPVSMKYVPLECTNSGLSNDTTCITLNPTDPELYAFIL